MRRLALLCCALLPACGEPPSDPPPGVPAVAACPIPVHADLVAPDGRPLAVDVGDLVVAGDQVLVLGPQVVTQTTPDSLELHREWLGARFPLGAVLGEAEVRTGTTRAEPVPVPPGVEPPTLLRGTRDGDGWRIVGTSPLPAGAPGTWVWTGLLGEDGWSGLRGIARPGVTPPEVGGSELRRAGGDLLWTVPAPGPAGWLVVRLVPGGLDVERIPVPLPYLVPLSLSTRGLEALWVEAETGPGGSYANSLFRGVIPMDDPRSREGTVLRRGGLDEVHHPVSAPGGEAVGFVSGRSEESRGWVLPLGPDGEAISVPGSAIAAVTPVRGADPPETVHEWVAVSAGSPPLTLTWFAEATAEPPVRSRTRIPHGLPPEVLRAGDALVLVGSRFLGPTGPGRFSTVRTAVAVLSPGCVDDARAPFPQTGRSP